MVLLIGGTAILRIAFAWATGLGVDESYMVASGRVLRLGYFDHPPASWWLQWGAAHLFGSDAPLAVRLPFIACFAVSTWLMYRLGSAVSGQRAGLWAAAVFNLSPVFSVTTGSWVLPDGPLDCALLGAAVCLINALPARGALALRWWTGAGLCAGLALFAKYSAVLTIAGAFFYLLTTPPHRQWLTRSEPYIAGFIVLLIFSPVIVWNAAHGWASFAFQGERATGLRFHPLQPFLVLAGEALFVLPWIWLPMMVVFVAALRRGPAEWRTWLLCCLAAPPIVAFALVALWSSQRVLFHWAAPGYLMLFPLLGATVAERTERRWVRVTLVGTAILLLGVVTVIATDLRLLWLHPAITAFARHDPEVEGIDWTSLRGQLTERHLLAAGTVIGVPNWRDAGKIAYALGPQVTVVVLNRDARQFGFDHPETAFTGDDMLVLALDHPERTRDELASRFGAVEMLPPISIDARGMSLQPVSVFIGERLKLEH
jgi:hypothetical protein